MAEEDSWGENAGFVPDNTMIHLILQSILEVNKYLQAKYV
jgi:hypothetical protein